MIKDRKPRQIGLLGGSFDPIHMAHLALAREAIAQFALDEVRLMPCAKQALKAHSPASAEARSAMIRLAIADDARLTLDCRELYRDRPVYTIDTIKELQDELPEAQLWFIMGMDSAQHFPRWHKAEELIALCDFIVFDRPGCTEPTHDFAGRLLAHRMRGAFLEIASSELRFGLAHGADIAEAIPSLPRTYLRKNHLYS